MGRSPTIKGCQCYCVASFCSVGYRKGYWIAVNVNSSQAITDYNVTLTYGSEDVVLCPHLYSHDQYKLASASGFY